MIGTEAKLPKLGEQLPEWRQISKETVLKMAIQEINKQEAAQVSGGILGNLNLGGAGGGLGLNGLLSPVAGLLSPVAGLLKPVTELLGGLPVVGPVVTGLVGGLLGALLPKA